MKDNRGLGRIREVSPRRGRGQRHPVRRIEGIDPAVHEVNGDAAEINQGQQRLF